MGDTASRGAEHWRSFTSATRARACSPRRWRAGVELDGWLRAEPIRSPPRAGRLRRGARLRRRDARRPGGPPPMAARRRRRCSRELLDAARAAAGRLPRRAAARRGGRGAGRAGRSRARDRLARGRGHRGGPATTRCSARSRPRFEAFQWHSYEFPLPPGATPLARSPSACRPTAIGELAWGIQFHAEVTRDGRGGLDRRLPRATRTRSASGSTRTRCGADPRARSAPGTSSAAGSASASWRAARYSGVT